MTGQPSQPNGVATRNASRIPELWRPRPFLAALLAVEGLAAVVAFAPGNTGDRWLYFAAASCLAVWACALVAGALYLLRNLLQAGSPTAAAFVTAALTTGSLLLAGAVMAWMVPSLAPWAQGEAFWPRLALTSITTGLFAAAALAAFVRARDAAVASREATLESLKARIRPHFLFNTLNTGAALVHARPGAAEQLLLDLADLFRAALSGPAELPLRDELSLARRYLEIERLRFGERLQVQWTLPETLPEVVVPALSIQPLVENAIRHGIEPSPTGGRLDVVVVVEPDEVRVVVSNDLPPSGTRPAAGHQVGLASARERIEALSQGRGHLQTRVAAGRYVATITLPL